jgi:hypothetical protein
MNIWPEEDLIGIRKKYNDFFIFIDDLINFVPSFMPEGKLRVDDKNHIGYSAAILALFIKSYKTIRGIKLLCMEGLPSDANALLRPLLECLISMRYLSDGDKSERGSEYFQFCHMQTEKVLNSLKKNALLTDMVTDDMENKVKALSNELKNEMGEIEFNKRYKASHWSGKSIEIIAKEVGLDVLYDLPFRLSSQAIHATDYLDHVDYDNGFIGNIFPGDRWCREVLGASIITFIQILKTVNAAFSLRQDEVINSFEGKSELLSKKLENS